MKIKILGAVLLSALLTMNVSFADAAKDQAVKQVKDAIELAKKSGKDVAVAEINKGKFHEGELYVTVFNEQGVCLAHPIKPDFVGQNQMNKKDPGGVLYIKERVEGVKKTGNVWTKFKFQNPISKKLEDKEMYSELYEGYVFSAGAYKK